MEIITDFLRGIITGNDLPNRAQLTNADKLKVIQDKTQLYTFRSTADYSMNYDAMLKRLYYKYPCHLTPNAKVTKEEKKTITDAALVAGGVVTYQYYIRRAIGASDKTKSHSIICAVAIATSAFIYHNTDRANMDANAILNHLNHIIFLPDWD